MEKGIENMSRDELRVQLKGAGLSQAGDKSELVERLRLHLNLHSIKGAEGREDKTDTTTVNIDERGVGEMVYGAGLVQSQNIGAQTTAPWPVQAPTILPVMEQRIAQPAFTFKDIEESISTFKGEESQNIRKWITEFEDVGQLVHWNALQMFIYGKRLLRGAAKMYVQSETGIRDWVSLKSALTKEFGLKVNSAEVHRLLRTTKKLPTETLREFLYRMIELAKPIDVDEESIVEYFVDALNDDKTNKVILYEAKTIEELKNKLRTYEKVRGQAHTSMLSDKRNLSLDKNLTRKCYNCNETTHLAKKCSNQVKCYKCGVLGHRSYECKGAASIKKDQVTNAKFGLHSKHLMKDIKVEGINTTALVDTGCDICLIRQDFLIQLRRANIIYEPIVLSGLGNHQVVTQGFIQCKVVVDKIDFEVKMHVVKEDQSPFSVVIGNDLLKEAIVIIGNGEIRFRRKKTEEEKLPFDEDKSNDELEGHLKSSISHINETCETEDEKPMNPCQGEEDQIRELHKEFEKLCCAVVNNSEIRVTDEVDLSHIPSTAKHEVEELILNYKPRQNVDSPVTMKIILKDESPIHHQPRRMPFVDRKEIERQIGVWLDDGIIQPSNSEFSSPALLVGKKDGTKRLCCDFRRINQQIMKDHFPMPIIDDLLDRLQRAKVFTTLDLVNGFFHVPIEPESRKYTSFIVHNGQYEFLKVPFGLCNSPAVFTRFVSVIFKSLVNEGVMLTYMDDIVILAENDDEAVSRLKRVLAIASENGLKLKWTKCQFLKTKIEFLGYIIEGGTIKPSDEKTRAVKEFPKPTDKKSVERFLGLTGYFRKFILNYAAIAKPLSDLLRKPSNFIMGTDQEVSFVLLRDSLVKSPVLKLFDPNAITEVHTDASKIAYGAVLLQKDNDDQHFHPVQYMSRKTTPQEEKYHSYELEVLAVVKALEKWRIYLLGRQITIVTDCKAFSMTINKKEIPLRVSRWAMFLQDFNYQVVHRAGTQMKHVDALSRIAMLIVDTMSHRIKEAQMQDPCLKAIRQVLEFVRYEDYFLKNGILYKDEAKELVVIPTAMEDEIITIAHKEGHFSTKKTAEIIEKTYFIPKLLAKVEANIRSCLECILAERKAGKQEGFLSPIEKEDRPLQTYHLDHVGPMENTKKKYNHILVVVDGFSKFVWLYPTKSTTSEEVVERLKKQASVFGNPRRIITDRGTAFTANCFEQYCREEDISHLVITTGVPRGNGQVERINRLLIPILTKLTLEDPSCWYKHVERVQQLINSTTPRSTKHSPFRILTGLEMRISARPEIQAILHQEIVAELDMERDKVRNEAKENIHKIQQENIRSFNEKRKAAKVYKVGDLVAVRRTQFGPGLKLKPKFLGPYKVTKLHKHERYDVEKVGDHEGPRVTSTAADSMKPWCRSIGTNDRSGGPNVGYIGPTTRAQAQRKTDNASAPHLG